MLALFVLVPRALAGLRRHPALLVGAALVGVPVALMLVFGYVGDGRVLWALPDLVAALLPLAIIAVAALGGLILIADDLRTRFGLAQRGLTPWQRLTGTATCRRPPRGARSADCRWWAWPRFSASATSATTAAAASCPWPCCSCWAAARRPSSPYPSLIAGLARSDRTRVTAAREDERRRVAAHLHDSVLQTLALVQRQAHDPAAVARLARRQEHELRAWMAGEVELGSETLGAALRAAVAEIEDDYDAVVELTIIGERALDRPTEALAAAAREALRNAARHAAGAPIFVFAQAGPDGAEVFVRDEGPGFEPATVPTERRGVRDSIVGRMAAVGGSAVVESRPGEGTEIALRIGIVE